MFRLMVWSALLFGFFTCGWSNLFGEEPSAGATQTAALLEPIVVHCHTLLAVQNDLSYSQDAQALEISDLECGLGNLPDHEISRLVRTERSSLETSQWFDSLGLGTGLLGTGWLFWGPNNTPDTGWAILLGGLGLKVVGTLFFDQAGTALYNAVERSNRLYWEKTVTFSSDLKAKGLSAIKTSWSTWNGFEYESDGKRLADQRDFENKFSATNDFEVQRLFRDSEGQGAAGTWLAILGGAGGLGTAMGYFTSSNTNEKTAYACAFAASTILFGLGECFLKEGESAKFNAVQRYNRFARGQEAVLPQGPKNEKDLLNFGAPVSEKGISP